MKQNLFFFFIIEIYSFTKKISDYYSDSNGLLTTLLSIGDPAGKMRYFQIDLEIPFNWIQSTSYEVGYSNALQFVGTDDVTIENVNTQCKLYHDYIKFPGSGVGIGKFFFYINQNENIKGFSSLSFSLQPGNEVFSLSKKLKEIGTINNNRFGFVPRHLPQSTNKESIIYFGDLPEEIKNYTKSISIKLRDTDTKWGFNINKIIFKNLNKNKVFIVNSFAILRSIDHKITVPSSFFAFLIDNIFSSFIERNICFLHKFNHYEQIECVMKLIKDLGELYLILDENIGLKLHLLDFFRVPSVNGTFLIETQLGENQWIIGNTILKYFATLFDIDNKIITFYGDNTILEQEIVELLTNTNYGANTIIFKLIIVTLMFGIFFKVYIFIKIKNN